MVGSSPDFMRDGDKITHLTMTKIVIPAKVRIHGEVEGKCRCEPRCNRGVAKLPLFNHAEVPFLHIQFPLFPLYKGRNLINPPFLKGDKEICSPFLSRAIGIAMSPRLT